MNSAAVPQRGMVLVDLLPGNLARDTALVLSGAGLTGLAAQVSLHLPISPVPFTLQTFAALLVGASLGSIRGLMSMTVYLGAGLMGVPWFAGGAHGYTVSFGYIVGFTLAAGVVGSLARRGSDRRVVPTVLLMAAGTALTYLIGASWLALALHLTVGEAWRLGVWPFLVGDVVKASAAAILLPSVWKIVSLRS